MDDDSMATLKFKSEFLGLLRRWLEESDLRDMDLVNASVELMNEYCNEGSVDFIPDKDFTDKLGE